MKRPLSAIIKEMAFSILRRPEARHQRKRPTRRCYWPTVAWNRRTDSQAPDYRLMRGEFEASNPNLWDELKSANPDELIAELAAYRELHHRNDQRYLVVCGMRGDNVHAEWI